MDVTPITRAAAIVFRAPDAATGYMWQLHAGDDALKTHRMIAGAFPTDARRTVPHVIDPGVTYRLSVRVQGQTFQTSIDGQVVDTWTDPSATGSRAGTIGFREASGEVADFDDVTVTSLDGATRSSPRTSPATSRSGCAARRRRRPTSTRSPAPRSTSLPGASSGPAATSRPATPPSSTSTASVSTG